jgi:hypothetical protein
MTGASVIDEVLQEVWKVLIWNNLISIFIRSLHLLFFFFCLAAAWEI